jgi:hypothetical protein
MERQSPDRFTLAELVALLGVREEVAFDWAESAGIEAEADGWSAVEVLGLLAAERGEGVAG